MNIIRSVIRSVSVLRQVKGAKHLGFLGLPYQGGSWLGFSCFLTIAGEGVHH